MANQLSWAKHKTKLADPIKTLAESINTAVSATFAKTINTDATVANQISGSLALEWATATIGTDAISPTYSAVLLGTESGATSDTLQTITATGVYNGALLNIRQRNATEEILLIHATSTAATATGANIYLARNANIRLRNVNDSALLQYDSNVASGWVQVSGDQALRVSGTITYTAGTPALSNAVGVSSITDVTTGDIVLHWAQPFPNATYFVNILQKINTSSTEGPRGPIIASRGATSCEIYWKNTSNAFEDTDFIFAVIGVP